MRSRWPVVLLGLTTVTLLHAQPNITSLQSAVNARLGPQFGAAITSGTPLATFTLYVNGTFNIANPPSVTWLNTVTNATQTFSIGSGIFSNSATQIVVTIPSALFSALVASAQTVNITVTELTVNSNVSPFTLNPPLAPPAQPILPAGTLNVPYSTNVFSGGTPPYAAVLTSGSILPVGLNLGTSQTLSGTATQTGLFPFTFQATDEWNNVLITSETVETVDQPTAGSVAPLSIPAGSIGVAITVTGTNFVAANASYNGSTIVLTVSTPGVNSFNTQLITTVPNANTAMANIPDRYLINPATLLSLVVVQPSGATSNSLQVTIVGPTITAVSPSPVTARPTPVTMTVSGSNYISIGEGGQSTVLSNGTAVATSFGGAASLSASLTLSTPGTVSFQVRNPGGSLSNIFNVTVLAAPTLASATPNPFPGGTLTVNGANFTASMLVLFNGTPLSTTFVSATQLTGTVPGFLYVGNTAQITVLTADDYLTNALTITLGQPMQITTTSLPAATGLQPYTASVAATGGVTPYAWTASGLPTGLNINGSTGAISGTPTAFGSFTVSVTVTDSLQQTASARLPLTVSTPTLPTITAVSPSPITARPTAIAVTVTGTNFVNNPGTAPSQSTILINNNAVTTAVNSATSLSTSAVFATPSVVPFQVQNPGNALSNVVNVTVLPTPVITSATPNPFPGGTLTVNGANFTATMSVLFNGTPIPTAYISTTQLTGAVPASLYTGTTAQISAVTTDNYVTNAITINLSQPPQITTTSLPAATGLQPYTAPVVATGGTTPYAWTSTGLPTGLTINGSTGAITGAPTAFGSFTVSVTVTDALQQTASARLPLTVSTPSSPTITAVSPSAITARTTAITVTVTGTNFVTNPAAAPAQSTILINNNAVTTTLNSATSLTGSAVFATPSVVPVQVQNPGNILSNVVNVTVLPAPVITSATNPFPGGTLVISGANFTATMTVQFNGTAIPTAFGSATQLTAAVPASFYTSGATALITVQTTDNYITPPTKIILSTPLQILTTSIGPASASQAYDAKFAATGGTPPYTWSDGGLPAGLSNSSSTGEITGTPTAFGSFSVSVTVKDANGLTATAQYSLTVNPPAAAPVLGSIQPPVGFVNVSYNFAFSATGGNGALTFAVGTGNPPPGLSLDSTGVLKGLPSTAGSFSFSVVVGDSLGFSTNASVTVVIKAQPLSIINSSPLPSVTVGAGFSGKFTAFGGVPPYTFGSGGNLPAGASLAPDGTLSGTATTAGTFAFTVTVNDSANDPPGSKSFSVTVNPAALTLSASFGNGQVGVAYSGQVSATGGVPPYSFSVGGLPDGVSFANGAASGTPTTAGQFTVSVSVTDSAKTTVTQSFPITIASTTLTITTSSLPNGIVNTAYSASLSASGGSGKFSWSVSGLPPGVSANAAGAISGTPTTAGTFPVSATVTDAGVLTAVISASKSFSITIAPPALSVSTTSLSNATAGAAYSATLAATGGVPPFTWSATGLPSGLTISAAGAIGGTTVVPGPASVTVTVKDSAGTTASQTYTLTVVLPAAPPLTVTGLPTAPPPGSQSNLQITLGAPFPVAVTVNLTLTFAANSGPDDPTVQFATGGRTAQLTVPAGATTSLTSVGLQFGTVAGTITITAQLLAGTQNITPTPAPTRTVVIGSVAPVASSVTATSTSTGFTVTVIGFATSRTMTQAVFTFTPAAGVSLQTTSVTIPVSSLFSAWWASSAATPFGSQFSFAQSFTVTGGTAAVASVSVVLTNGDGSSTPVSATVH